MKKAKAVPVREGGLADLGVGAAGSQRSGCGDPKDAD